MNVNKLISDKRAIVIIIFIFFMGIMLLGGNENEKENKVSNKEELNVKLEKILSDVEGAGKVKVLINYKQSGEKILAYDLESNTNEKDSQKENKSKSEVVYDGNKMPVVLKEYMPKVEGVIIVEEGKKKKKVKKQLISGTMALLGIDEHKIEVLKMK